MEKMDAAHTLTEMQHPPLYYTHGILTVRELHQRLLEAAQVVDQLSSETKDRKAQIEEQNRLIAQQWTLLNHCIQALNVNLTTPLVHMNST